MFNFVNYKGLGYNNVSIVPSLGKVNSRTEIPIEGFRIIIAGMSSIIGEDFLKEWAKLPKEIRPLLHIPRNESSLKFLSFIVKNNLQEWTVVGVGLKTDKIINYAAENNFQNVLLDVAFGGLPQIKNFYNKLRLKFGKDATLICGSISTAEQANYLASMGWDCVRLGVGTSASACATRNRTGVFVGAVTEIINVKSFLGDESDINIIADGGFQQIGDFSKAFLLGADFCMSGGIFTRCKTAQMNIDGSHLYHGMSSKTKGIRAGKTTFDEAKEKVYNYKKLYSLQELLEMIWGGIRSTISYSGYSTLKEAIGNGEFIELKTPVEVEEW